MWFTKMVNFKLSLNYIWFLEVIGKWVWYTYIWSISKQIYKPFQQTKIRKKKSLWLVYTLDLTSWMEWLDLLAVQGTLKSLLQHHSSKAQILRCSAFFTVQLSHPYMTTGKTIALTRQTFVGKLMSLLFNMLSSQLASNTHCLASFTEVKLS